jgi:lipopolysaccharide transport system ATP-binding protein
VTVSAAIEVTGIGKEYRLGGYERYESIREIITRSVTGAFRRSKAKDAERRFWALRDVSFTIPHGQIVGIVGRNGAGKSTLLKLLARITEPTEGRATIWGRVGSLLEVGVGFHPELTGRENIFLNGAILGMRRSEIRRKFDEIVAFAEIEKFLDTPVKRYSSGMYVRLAFSVAAHLEPEILLVDEVLAVGDAAFQKKCLGKMTSVARTGRTILFVSHNMIAVNSLCERGLLVESGRITADDTANKIVDKYLEGVNAIAEVSLKDRQDRQGNGALRFSSFELRNAQNQPIPYVAAGQDVEFLFSYESANGSNLTNVKVAFTVHGKFDECLFQVWTKISGYDFDALPSRGTVRCRIPKLPLQPGAYTFNLFSSVNEEIADWIQNASAFSVEPGDFFRTGRLPLPDQGPLLVDHSWSAE